jgi:Fe-S-cluster containining protein
MRTAGQKKADTTSHNTGPMPCQRCGVCCTRYQAYAGPDEIERIIAWLGITPDDWQNLYNDPRWEYGNSRLIRHVNGACAFLKYQNRLATCAIYAVRPACCAAWQPGPDKKECREGKKMRQGKPAPA